MEQGWTKDALLYNIWDGRLKVLVPRATAPRCISRNSRRLQTPSPERRACRPIREPVFNLTTASRPMGAAGAGSSWWHLRAGAVTVLASKDTRGASVIGGGFALGNVVLTVSFN